MLWRVPYPTINKKVLKIERGTKPSKRYAQKRSSIIHYNQESRVLRKNEDRYRVYFLFFSFLTFLLPIQPCLLPSLVFDVFEVVFFYLFRKPEFQFSEPNVKLTRMICMHGRSQCCTDYTDINGVIQCFLAVRIRSRRCVAKWSKLEQITKPNIFSLWVSFLSTNHTYIPSSRIIFKSCMVA